MKRVSKSMLISHFIAVLEGVLIYREGTRYIVDRLVIMVLCGTGEVSC